MVLIPDQQVGFSIEINSEDGEIINGLVYELLDHYLGAPPNDWPAKFSAYQQQRLQEAIQTLPIKFRSVVLLRYAGQLSFSEIGQILNMPEATAKTYYQRAKPLLRAALMNQVEYTAH